MEKEFEELKNIVAVHFGALGFLNPSENEQILKDRDKVLNALTELIQIKESNASEALKELDYIGETCYVEAESAEGDCILYAKNYFGYNTIKNYLLKAQKQEQENKFLKDALKILIKIDDSDLSHLKLKVISQNVAVNQDIIKLLKEVL